MIYHLIHLLIVAVGLLVAAKVVPGVHVRSFGGAVVFALVLAVLNKLLYGVLVLLSLPLVFVTLGLFLFAINAFLFWLADKLVSGVEVESFGAALLGSVVTSAVSWLGMVLIR